LCHVVIVLFDTSSSTVWMHGPARRFFSNPSDITCTTCGDRNLRSLPGEVKPSGAQHTSHSTPRVIFLAYCFKHVTRRFVSRAVLQAAKKAVRPERRGGRPLSAGYYTQWQTFATENSVFSAPIGPRASCSASLLRLASPPTSVHFYTLRRCSAANVAREGTEDRHTINSEDF